MVLTGSMYPLQGFAPTDATFNIGFATGDFAAWGQAYLEGITLGEELTNRSGGIRSRQVELVVEDTRFDSALTASASKKLLSIDKVSAR